MPVYNRHIRTLYNETLFGRRAYIHVHAYVLDRYPDLGHLGEACLEPTEITTLQN